MSAYTKEVLEDLQNRINSIKTNEEYQQYLKTISQLYKYSFGNAMWIAAQKRDATMVQSFKKWKDLGRFVKKGEKGIKILVPIFGKKKEQDDDNAKAPVWFKVGNVFDVSQTDGEPLPEIDIEATTADFDTTATFNSLVAYCQQNKIVVEVVDNMIVNGALGVSCMGKIQIKKTDNHASMTAVLIHEIAHELLHGLHERKTLSKEVKEIEAESVSYVVCQSLGIDSCAPQYLAIYQKDYKLVDSIKTISKAAKAIMESLKQPQEKVA